MTNNIDIIITVVLRADYVKLLIESIDKYTKYPYKIYIVTDIRNKEEQELYDYLNEFYNSRDDIFIVKSENKDTRMGNEGWVTLEAGNQVGLASIFKSIAYETGIKAGNGKYVCLLDYDCIFLSEWTESVLPMVDKNFFVSAMWRGDLNIARDQFFIYERSKFEECNLMPDCSVGDTTGNVTYYAHEHNLDYYICPNSAKHWGDESLRQYHVLDLNHGEQIFIPVNEDSEYIPFLYHYGRGSARDNNLYEVWRTEISKYLKAN
tara:strand:- start:741 stop:1529 length:789 start_codon:yes stop_codon:yes gene_type:complete